MNRPGQAPQRPPSLASNPGLAGPYRTPYPSYGMPPRNTGVLQGGYVPNLQPTNHRATSQQVQAPSMVPQPTPGFMQQRGPGAFAFGGGLSQAQSQGPHQQSTSLQQHSANPQQSSQQTNGSSNLLPPHIAQAPNLGGTAPSASSASEVGLDLNDFPALGSTPATSNSNSNGNGNMSSNVATSYASQAGTGVPLGVTSSSAVASSGTIGVNGGVGSTSSSTQPRDFTPDDFPALGGQAPATSQHQHSQQSQNQDNHAHPPGLNGFQHADHAQQQHRQNLLGSLGSAGAGMQQTPGMLNLGPAQARSVHPGFQQGQTEAEKQQQRNNYALKLNQATHAAWNSPSVNPTSQSQIGVNSFANMSAAAVVQSNGTHQNSTPNPNSNNSNPNSNPGPSQNPQQSQSQQHLGAPPGMPPPSSASYSQQQQQQQPQQHPPANHTHGTGPIASLQANSPNAPTPYTPNGLAPGESHPTNSSIIQQNSSAHPQTPAQQVLMSAADRWGLLGLLAMIKSVGADLDEGLSSFGTDLGTMGLDMGYTGNLYSTFITPWADQSAAHTVEPDFHLPACYNVQPPPPGPNKAAAFSDETLFFMFYSSPRDALQEVAAQELWNRNWRYHKDLRLWITKETGTSPSQKVPGGEQGTYTFWDPENWGKERKDMTVLYADLEEKSVPVFAQGAGLVPVQASQGQGVGQAPQQQQQQQQQSTHQQQLQQVGQPQQSQMPPQRASFQMGIAGL